MRRVLFLVAAALTLALGLAACAQEEEAEKASPTATVARTATPAATRTPQATPTPAPPTPTPTPTPAPPPTPVAPTPKTEQPIVFTGNGTKNTGDFYISSSQFTISWIVEGDFPEAVIFSMNVIPVGGDMFVDTVLFQGIGSDSTVVHAGPGSFWLQIIAANCTWRIEVKP